MELKITSKTFEYITNDSYWQFLIEFNEFNKIKIEHRYECHYLIFQFSKNTVSQDLILISDIYKNLPTEKNVWIYCGETFPIESVIILRSILLNYEKDELYPLARHRLRNIIKENNICSLRELRELPKRPFAWILSLEGIDFDSYFNKSFTEYTGNLIEEEYPNFSIRNRYINKDFNLIKGKITFENCIIEGNIEITCADSVTFSQCIIIGNVQITATSYVCFSFSNIKQVCIYNSVFKTFDISDCKIFRFILHSSKFDFITLYRNRFIETYLAKLNLPDNFKFDVSQFDIKNVNHKIIKKISNSQGPQIKRENEFYLSYSCDEPQLSITEDNITFDMANLFLTHGDLFNNHRLYANMKYEKAYCSNSGLRKWGIFLTGAFYKPSRWILYILINTIIFTILYLFIPELYFTNTVQGGDSAINIGAAIYFSMGQIIGSNPTIYIPVGITEILATIQSLLNTVFLANMAASLVKKYLHDDI